MCLPGGNRSGNEPKRRFLALVGPKQHSFRCRVSRSSPVPRKTADAFASDQSLPKAYRAILQENGLVASMSRKGNCYDNAPIESFWGSLKNEMVHHQRFETRAQAESAIREYIEIFYNRQRRHSRIGYLAPAVFAQSFTRLAA